VSEEIPTASMADVAFLLLIFFLVTVTFAATRGPDFRLPQDDDAPRPIEPDEAVLVEVLGEGSLRVDRKTMRLDELLGYLGPKLARNPAKPVIVKTALDAPYGAMVDVLDELRQGRERLGMAEDIVVSIPTEREIVQLWPEAMGIG
jgi:biopolymer transport protein ExbD